MGGALSHWMVRGVPAMGGFPTGAGVCVSCLLGVNGGLVVLLLLLSGFFPFLFLIRVVGAMVAWLEQAGCRVREFFTPAVRLGKSGKGGGGHRVIRGRFYFALLYIFYVCNQSLLGS